MDSWKNRWGVGQWAAYFENQALPVMRRSKLLMAQLDSAEGEMLSPRDLSDIVLQDPLLKSDIFVSLLLSVFVCL